VTTTVSKNSENAIVSSHLTTSTSKKATTEELL
jgi:hypothetical protein